MATVLAMRLNRDQALLVADESTWHLGHVFGYRRANYADSLADLVDPAATAETGLAAVYGGVGFPSMHADVTREVAAWAATARPGGNGALRDRVHEAYVRGHRRLVDDKLRFDYGFSLDELNARAYERDGTRHEIGQEAVAAAARALAGGGGPGNATARIFSSEAFLLSRDREHGIQGWYLSPTGAELGFVTPLAVIGDGGALGSHLMAEYVERRHLHRRRAGFGLREGLFVGLRIAAEIYQRVGTMGGYLQVMLLDGDAGVREITSDATQLAAEIMKAHLWQLVSRRDARDLAAALLLDGAGVDATERELFARAGDAAPRLERYLMGFKPTGTPRAADVDPLGEPGPGRAAPPAPAPGRGKRAAGPRRKAAMKAPKKGATARRKPAKKGARK